MKTGDKLTVPVFTDICSAVCWGENVATIHDCPYNGRRLDGKGSSGSQRVDQALADRFLGWTSTKYQIVFSIDLVFNLKYRFQIQ